MNPAAEKLHQKYMEHPPERMTSEDIRHMSEDDLFDDDFGEEICRICSLATAIKILLFDKNCHI